MIMRICILIICCFFSYYCSSQIIEPEMVLVQGGAFQMGANDSAFAEERPVHTLTLNSFYMSKYEVTVAEFAAFVTATGYLTDAEKSGYGQVYSKGSDIWQQQNGVSWIDDETGMKRTAGLDSMPVVQVSWNDALAYCQWLKSNTGKNFRLPTEAEWEYAARGGNQSNGYIYSGSNELDTIAWVCKTSNHMLHKVGQKQPNELGIYDMTGNVWEWCNDWYDPGYYKYSPSENPSGPGYGTKRCIRGSGWYNVIEDYSRTGYRGKLAPDYRYGDIGFRVVYN